MVVGSTNSSGTNLNIVALADADEDVRIQARYGLKGAGGPAFLACASGYSIVDLQRPSASAMISSLFNPSYGRFHMHVSKRLVLIVSLFVIISGRPADGAEKVKVLFVSGFDHPVHTWEESTKLNQAILQKSNRFDVSVSQDKEVFASPKLSDYDVLVLNFGFWKEADPSDKAKAGLLEYVKGGGNVVALHFACGSFQDWKEYRDMLGRVWVKGTGGHGPFGEFTVKIKDAKHPVTNGLKDFKIEEELYAKLSGEAQDRSSGDGRFRLERQDGTDRVHQVVRQRTRAAKRSRPRSRSQTKRRLPDTAAARRRMGGDRRSDG